MEASITITSRARSPRRCAPGAPDADGRSDQLAARGGISRRLIVQLEQADANPRLATLLKVAAALDVTLPSRRNTSHTTGRWTSSQRRTR